jgi:hypothetical protein
VYLIRLFQAGYGPAVPLPFWSFCDGVVEISVVLGSKVITAAALLSLFGLPSLVPLWVEPLLGGAPSAPTFPPAP